MSVVVEYLLNKASEVEIAKHLFCCDANFVPPLRGRVDINDYAKKIVSKATRFEAWSGEKLVGLVAVYSNDQEKRVAYITSVSVLQEWMRKGIAAKLVSQCIEHVSALGMSQISLEVAHDNEYAIRLYKKNKFVASLAHAQILSMSICLKSGENNE